MGLSTDALAFVEKDHEDRDGMLEILQFIFSSFWVWLGTIVLIALPIGFIAEVCTGIIHGLRSRKEP